MTAELARHLAHVRRLAGVKKPRRRGRIPRQVYPRMLEHEYAEAISEVTGRAARRSLAGLLEELPSLLERARLSRADSSETFAGLPVVIENRRGSVRDWTDSDGTTGSTLMLYDYGYIEGATGVDGDEVDVYLGPDADAEWVYVIHQRRRPSLTRQRAFAMYGVPIKVWEEYDEDKVMLGFPSPDAARVAYLSQYNDPRFFGGMSTFSLDHFKSRLVHSEGAMIAHRMDSGEGRRARELVEKARDQMKATTNLESIEALGKKFAVRTATYQRLQLSKQVKAALGVDPILKDKGLHVKVDHFSAENAALIKSMQTNVHDEVEKIVTRAVVNGTPHADVSDEIEERFGISESHARLIARDQMGKLYGQINASRQRELGVKKFIWRTVGDERVRGEHEDLETQSELNPFSLDDPPNGELPGEPIQCRCTAEPVFELDSVEED